MKLNARNSEVKKCNILQWDSNKFIEILNVSSGNWNQPLVEQEMEVEVSHR